MTWHKRRHDASFRGIPFHVESIDAESGRRTETIRLAGTPDVIQQDLGPDTRTFTVNAYVIGPDYDGILGDLEAALLEEGPGSFVHPTLGERSVVVNGRFKFSESKASGGMATFSITFTEVMTTIIPVVDYSTAVVSKSVEVVRSSLRRSLEAAVANDPLATDAIDSLTSYMTAATRLFASVTGKFDAAGTIAATLLASPRAVIESLSELVTAPGKVAEETFGLMQSLFSSSETLAGDITQLVGGEVGDSSTVEGSPLAIVSRAESLQALPSSPSESESQNAFLQLLRVSTVVEAAERLIGARFDSYNEADDISQRFVALLDDLELDILDDQVFADLSTMRGAIVVHLSRVAATLPELRGWSSSIEMPTILVAHQLYGDARRESEILTRNRRTITHPSFVAARAQLEVLGV